MSCRNVPIYRFNVGKKKSSTALEIGVHENVLISFLEKMENNSLKPNVCS